MLAWPRLRGAWTAPAWAGILVAAAVSPLAPGTAPGWAAERIAGNVLAVDVEGGEITLLDAGRRLVVGLAPEATIRAGGQDRALADLKRGDRIVVTLVDGETARAARVVVAGPGRIGGGSVPGASVPGFASGLNARTPPR